MLLGTQLRCNHATHRLPWTRYSTRSAWLTRMHGSASRPIPPSGAHGWARTTRRRMRSSPRDSTSLASPAAPSSHSSRTSPPTATRRSVSRSLATLKAWMNSLHTPRGRAELAQRCWPISAPRDHLLPATSTSSRRCVSVTFQSPPRRSFILLPRTSPWRSFGTKPSCMSRASGCAQTTSPLCLLERRCASGCAPAACRCRLSPRRSTGRCSSSAPARALRHSAPSCSTALRGTRRRGPRVRRYSISGAARGATTFCTRRSGARCSNAGCSAPCIPRSLARPSKSATCSTAWPSPSSRSSSGDCSATVALTSTLPAPPIRCPRQCAPRYRRQPWHTADSARMLRWQCSRG
mmetsp:Transcript_52084/g.170219  ORF Transcript_52084/g.170219 Transcript_52084/m.170219 type:complete len:350 (+) Transcript_52084:757-1806(+)